MRSQVRWDAQFSRPGEVNDRPGRSERLRRRNRTPNPGRPRHGEEAPCAVRGGARDVRDKDRRDADGGQRDRHLPEQGHELQSAQGGVFRGDGRVAPEHIGEDPKACTGGAVGAGLSENQF